MYKIFPILLRFAIVFAIIFFLIQPYNLFCNFTSSCKPFSFSYFIPSFEGKREIEIDFEARNFIDDLEFRTDKDSLKTYTGIKNVVTYYIKNKSNHLVKFRTKLYVDPETLEEYVNIIDCPCSKQYKLKKGQEIKIKIEFKLKRKIEDIIFAGIKEKKTPEGKIIPTEKVNNMVKIGFKTRKI